MFLGPEMRLRRFTGILFFNDEQIKVVVEQAITLVVAEVIRYATTGGIQAGEVMEVEAQGKEAITCNLTLTRRIEPFQYAVVVHKNPVYPMDITQMLTIIVVMKGAPALVGTEFLVRPTFHQCSTHRAWLFTYVPIHALSVCKQI